LFCNESVEISELTSTALFTLTHRPILYKYILDEYANSRRNAIIKLFIDALTKGGPNGQPRPIELNSHDPIRYMGDMLAWIHQATASENEFLKSFFKKFKESNDLEQTIKKTLGLIMDGVCKALRVSKYNFHDFFTMLSIFDKIFNTKTKDKSRASFGEPARHYSVQDIKFDQVL
jgi:hypothetical protein